MSYIACHLSYTAINTVLLTYEDTCLCKLYAHYIYMIHIHVYIYIYIPVYIYIHIHVYIYIICIYTLHTHTKCIQTIYSLTSQYNAYISVGSLPVATILPPSRKRPLFDLRRRWCRWSICPMFKSWRDES